MRIVFTGGGTGGHFYPLIAVAQALGSLERERSLPALELFYFGPEPYDLKSLEALGIQFKKSPAGKLRRYFSFKNITDIFKTLGGIVIATGQLFSIYPDVVFSKGGYASFPTLVAARLLRIPVVIHESDIVPGRVTKWAAAFARRIAVSYPETASAFQGKNVARLGNPIRAELLAPALGTEALPHGFEAQAPLLLVLGGSQGAKRINDAVLEALPKLVERYQVLHQTGPSNYEEVRATASVALRDNPNAKHYKAVPFLETKELSIVGQRASLIISRAGSGTIFEIAAWGVPAIVVPIPETISHDQRKNAFSYGRSGGAVVIEESNLSPNLLIAEIDRILSNPELTESMKAAAHSFGSTDAAYKIAEGLLEIALQHEQ